MAIAISDCDLLIPEYRRNSYLYLSAGVVAIVCGAALIVLGPQFGVPELGQIGGIALSTTGLLPFRGYYTASRHARLLEKVKRMLAAGEVLSPLTDQLVQKVILEYSDA